MNLRTVGVVLALLFAAGCSGGGGGGGQPAAPIPPHSGGPSAAQTATVSFSFPAPSKSSAKSPHFVSPNAAYFVSTINSYNGITTFPSWLPQTTSVALTTGQGGNCAISGPTETCTVAIPTYPGTVAYTFELENSTHAVLAKYSSYWKIAQGQNTTITFTFQGVPVTVTVEKLTLTLYSHRVISQAISVKAYDASGSQITSGYYATPITLTTDDTSGATSLSVSHGPNATSVSLTEPGTYVRLNYSGLAIPPFHLIASGGAITSGTTTVTPQLDPILIAGTSVDTLNVTDPNYHQQTLYIDAIPPATTPQFTASELGWSEPPYSKTFTVTPDPTKCSSSVATVTTTDNLTFTVTPKVAGYCKLLVAGGGGQTKVVWVSITTASIGINANTR